MPGQEQLERALVVLELVAVDRLVLETELAGVGELVGGEDGRGLLSVPAAWVRKAALREP